MRWDDEQKDEVHQLIDDLWSGHLKDAQWEIWKESLGCYRSSVVLRALKKCAKERERATRPQPCEVMRYCAMEQRYGREEEKSEDRCPWCLGLSYVRCTIWSLPILDIRQRQLPESAYRTTTSDRCCVRPEIAKEMQIGQEKEIRVACGHCEPRLGSITCLEMHTKYGGFFVVQDGEEETMDRCLQSRAPSPPQTIDLHNFLLESQECGRELNANAMKMLQWIIKKKGRVSSGLTLS